MRLSALARQLINDNSLGTTARYRRGRVREESQSILFFLSRQLADGWVRAFVCSWHWYGVGGGIYAPALSLMKN